MKDKATVKDWIITAVFIIVCICLIAAIEHHLRYNPYDTPKPSGVNVDSLLSTNDSIKQVITTIDSIKEHEIQKVSTLSSDSTIKLFKELVRE